MDTYRLKQFCTIAETGSMTKAAKLLHITHSALSKSMKVLQEELCCALLRPSGRGLALTDEGLRIYPLAKEFLKQEELFFKIKKSREPTSIRIGTVEIFLLTIIEQFKFVELGQTTMTLLDLDPGNIEQMIVNRQLDYGITYAPFPMSGVEITEIGDFYLKCYHLHGTFKGLNISEIPFVVPAQGLSNNPLGIRERDGWIESIYPRNKKYSVNLLATAIELTLQGQCAIYLPDFVANKINFQRGPDDQLVEYPLPKLHKNKQTVFLLRHKDKEENSEFKKLYKAIKKTITASSCHSKRNCAASY